MIRAFVCVAVMFVSIAVGNAQEAEVKSVVPVKCWEYATGTDSARAVSSNATSVFVISGASTVKALNSIDGNEEWASELGGEIVSNIVAGRERLYVVTSSIMANGVSAKVFTLRGLSRSTGLPVSSATLPTAESFRLIVEEEIVIALGSAGSVNAFDQSGSALWNFAIGGKITAGPVAFRSGITLAAEDKTLRQVMVKTGDTSERFPGKTSAISLARDANGTIFLGDDSGRLYRINGDTGREDWNFRGGGRFESIEIVGSNVLAASVDNFVYLISGSSGDVIWKRRLPGRIFGKPLIFNEQIFVAIIGELSLFILDATSGKITGRLSSAGELGAEPIKTFSGELIVNLSDKIAAYRPGECRK